MSNDLWNEFEKFWDREEVKEKAERYQELYKNPEIEDEEFPWINDNDRDDLKRKKSKAIHWGIPNHILGDIDNAKFIVGLFNPGTHMDTEKSKKCETVGDYIKKEVKIEKKEVERVDFESKEIFEGDSNNTKELVNFYYNHILSKENVISQELKKLYKIYKEDKEEFNLITKKLKKMKLAAYYKGQYYSKMFEGSESAYKNAMKHYRAIFKQMEEAESLGYDVEEKFEKALYNIKVANIELIPYRSFEKGDLTNIKNLESSRLSANTIIEKIKKDKDTVVFLRSYSYKEDKKSEDTYDSWKNLFIDICNKRNIDYEKDIAPSIYKFKQQNAAISKANIVHTQENNENVKSVSDVIDELHEEISLNKFKEELTELTKNNG